MFRGGKVSSYGTGIASGLGYELGGRVGYQRGGGTGGPVIIPHPNGKRRLSVRETARLQAFPDDMFFCGSISSGYRQIGNAVAWPVAYALGRILKKLKN